MSYHDKLTTEMDKAEWAAFRRDWIKDWAESIVAECGVKPEDAQFTAELGWEKYCGQEGWTGRDLEISERRTA